MFSSCNLNISLYYSSVGLPLRKAGDVIEVPVLYLENLHKFECYVSGVYDYCRFRVYTGIKVRVCGDIVGCLYFSDSFFGLLRDRLEDYYLADNLIFCDYVEVRDDCFDELVFDFGVRLRDGFSSDDIFVMLRDYLGSCSYPLVLDFGVGSRVFLGRLDNIERFL